MEEKNLNQSSEWTRKDLKGNLIQFLLILQKTLSSFREVLQIAQGHDMAGVTAGPRTKLRRTRQGPLHLASLPLQTLGNSSSKMAVSWKSLAMQIS